MLAGTAACEKGIKKKSVCLLLLQHGLSDNSRQTFLKLCERYNIDCLSIDEKDSIGSAIGRPEIMILAITDRRFAKQIKKELV